MYTIAWCYDLLAKSMYTCFTEQLITILTDAIQTKEHSLVKDALAFQIEKITSFRQIMTVRQSREYGNQNKKQRYGDLNIAGTHLKKLKEECIFIKSTLVNKQCCGRYPSIFKLKRYRDSARGQNGELCSSIWVDFIFISNKRHGSIFIIKY